MVCKELVLSSHSPCRACFLKLSGRDNTYMRSEFNWDPEGTLLGGFRGSSFEDLEKLLRVLFPDLVLNAGWDRGSSVSWENFPGQESRGLFSPVIDSPGCESVKARASASSSPW